MNTERENTNTERATLLELIDAYAEARHVGGCHTYNAKTAEARAKVAAQVAALTQPADTNTANGAADLPNALRLANELEESIEGFPEATELEHAAAAELRRLHALTAQAISAEPAGAGYAALTSQEICDIFSFLEGMVTETCYMRIVRVAEKIQADALRVASHVRVPLHPVEAMRLVLEVDQQNNFLRGTTNWAVAVARAIERHHGIKEGGQHGAE